MKNKNLENLLEGYITKNKENYFRLAFSYVKNTDDAMDVVQEAIYKAFSTLDSLINPQYIKTWLYRIIINTSLNFIRNRKRLVVVDYETFNDLDSAVNDVYENIDLKNALEKLPEQYKNIIILRFFEDLKINEIAEILSENISTVKTRLYKALNILHIQLSDDIKEA